MAVGFNVPVAEMHTAQSLARETANSAGGQRRAGRRLRSKRCGGAAARIRDLELGDALLRQRVLAGVGNVFKSEICFAAGLNPFRKVGTLTRDQAAEAVAVARRQLEANVLEDSGDTIVTYRGRRRRTTHRSDPGESLWVYGRRGQPCRRCGELIRRRLQGADARATYWCPRCQPMPDGTEIDG